MNTHSVSVPTERIVNNILLIRGKKVMIDADLAELYGVETKVLNQAVKRNKVRFPEDFMFRLTKDETKTLNSRSQIMTLNRSQFVTGSQKHRDPQYLPYAFTEHGVAMLSSVLKSPRAVQMNIYIIRAFVKLREVLASNRELAQKIEELERDQKHQNHHINRIYNILGKLMEEPQKPQNTIGFNQ